MKIIGIVMIKNEADVIESFIRINSRVLDEIHIVDDGSDDQSLEILFALQRDGFPIYLYDHKIEGVQPQASVMTMMLRRLSQSPWDYAVLLDADEFLIEERPAIQADFENMQGRDFGLLKWLTFVPTTDTYEASVDPLNSIFLPRRSEISYEKLVVPHAKALVTQVTPGNHSAAGTEGQYAQLETRLAHVPVRSSAQIMAKALIGSHRLSIKRGRVGREGFHWDEMAESVRKASYKLNVVELQRMTLNYEKTDRRDQSLELLLEPKIPSIGALKYTDLSRLTLLSRLDNFVAELCRQLIRSGERIA